jgi:pimeloyl-ACP methyl ester carboxylesterase
MIRRTLLAAALGLIVIVPLARADKPSSVDSFFDSNGVRIHYTIQGQGEPVLLIHGFAANIPFQWGVPGIVGDLSRHYRVIAIDNRGHGQSGKPHNVKQYGMEMVEDQIRLLDHLKIKKAHVVGYSMGAMITNKLLVTHPDRLLSATLGGAAAIRKGSDMSTLELLAQDLDQGKGIGLLITFLTPEGQPKPTAQQLQGINAMFTRMNDQKALAAVVRGWKDIEVTDDELKANKVPTLGLIGEIDPLKKRVDETKDVLANFTVVVIKGADHMNAFTRPVFMSTLKEFLAKNSADKTR